MQSTKKQTLVGILMMIVSALITCTAQLLWKLAGVHGSLLYLIVGVVLYGIGAVLMLLAFRYGEASVLHPMMSVGYIGSLFLGWFFLRETISLPKLLGVGLILLGLVLMVFGSRGKENS